MNFKDFAMLTLQANFTQQYVTISNEKYDLPTLAPGEILIKVKACYVDLDNEKQYHQLLTKSLKSCSIGRDVCGEIVKIGSNVETLQEGMTVVGFISYDFQLGGCSQMCICNQFDVVEKPNSVSDKIAATCIGLGLAAYTAMHYQGHVTAGDTVLVLDGGTPRGNMMVQMAQAWGAKVLATYRTEAEKQLLENLKPPVARIIDLTHRTNILVSSVMEETGGVGVDCIIDNGVRLFTSEEDKDLMEERNIQSIPHKQDIIGSLGFSGKWITCHPKLQLDPPDSHQLFLRGSSISFLFPPAWYLMRAQHGRFLHILKDIMNHVQNGELRCNDITTIPLSEATDALLSKDYDSTKCLVVEPE